MPGESDSEIIVGGHFDFVDHGQGIVDDWSGVALLPSLYEAEKSNS
jgi:Zn-dependent M28 family amino/carboxypeptidase